MNYKITKTSLKYMENIIYGTYFLFLKYNDCRVHVCIYLLHLNVYLETFILQSKQLPKGLPHPMQMHPGLVPMGIPTAQTVLPGSLVPVNGMCSPAWLPTLVFVICSTILTGRENVAWLPMFFITLSPPCTALLNSMELVFFLVFLSLSLFKKFYSETFPLYVSITSFFFLHFIQ